MWELVAASFHNDVLFDSEVRCARDDSVVASLPSARECEVAAKLVLNGMPRMGVTEELHALCGIHSWRWRYFCRRKK